MSLIYPTFEELSAQIRAEFRVQLPDVDPTVFGSWAMAFADGNAVLAQSIAFLVRDLERQLFPQTATGDFLAQWGGYEGLSRNPDSAALGNITVAGTPGTVIPVLTDFTGSNGVEYRSTAVSTIISVNQSITTLTRVGTTVTAVLSGDHQLADTIAVTVSGATQPEYNGTFAVTVTDRDIFQYQISSTPATPATGTPVYDVDIGSVPVSAQSLGSTTNLSSGAQLSFTSDPPTGAADTGFVQFDGLTGGSAEETDDDYRARIMLSRAIIEGVFTPDQIKLAALSIAGNTRAFIKKPTLSVCPGGGDAPVPGQTSVFVLRDNDPSIVPSQTILDATKAVIITDGALPAHMSESDLFVQGPTLVNVVFTFSALNPDTPTMRTAVEDNLRAFFEDTVDFEEDVPKASYLGAIQNTQDLQTGAFMVAFTLTSPSGLIPVGSGEIAAFGGVIFTI